MHSFAHAAMSRSVPAGGRSTGAGTARPGTHSLQRSLGNDAVRHIWEQGAPALPSGAALAEGEVPGIVEVTLSGPSQQLDPAVRAEMESQFGRDFGEVRIHVGGDAATSASAVNAKAYAVGQHVVFGTGNYAPGTMAGRELLAHELAHVVQQSRGGAAPSPASESNLEAGAQQAAAAATRGGSPVEVGGASGVGLARQPQSVEEQRKRVQAPAVAPSSAILYGYDSSGQPVYVLGAGSGTSTSSTPSSPAADAPIEEVVVHGVRPKRPPKPAAPPPTPKSPPQPSQAPPQTGPSSPDWTTQTEWVFPTTKHSPFEMVRTLDTGNRVLNFALNKVLVPWRNLLAAIENTPFEMLGALDDAMRASPFSMEWQAFQDMAPLMPAMGLSMRAPGALDALRGALLTTKRAETAEEGLTLLRGAGQASTPYNVVVRNGRPTIVFGEGAPSFGYRLTPPSFEPFPVEGSVPSLAPSAPVSLNPALGTLAEDFVPEFEGSNTLVPRQLSLFDIRPALRGAGRTGPQYSAEWNKLLEYLYAFEPRPGETYQIGGVSYSFDSEKRLVKVATDKVVRGVRWDYVNRAYPQKIPGFDYGHVGGIEAFGTNDILLQTRGGFPQAAFMNRSGAWRIAEQQSNSVVFDLQNRGLGFNKVAEVREFVNGVPTEWRLYVESGSNIVYDSGWLKAPQP
ncbi:protein of unknown function [Rhizobiales bacterium GAS191]|nr:protein of unknown function [Rhizobiales bacterium GAS191]